MEVENKSLTSKQIDKMLINKFLDKIKKMEINDLPLLTVSSNRANIMFNKDIELSEINQWFNSLKMKPVKNYVDILIEAYAHLGSTLIKDLPYPYNEQKKNLPLISFSPMEQNPKVIKVSY
jgi:hypothetical protein